MAILYFDPEQNSSIDIGITFQNPDNLGTEIPIPGFYSWFPKGLSTCASDIRGWKCPTSSR